MNTRKIIIGAAGILIFLGTVALSGLLSGESPVKETKETVATVVRTKTVNLGNVKANVEITGRVIPSDRVDLFAEVTGVSSYGNKPFKAGIDFNKGETLLKIDSRELVSTLASSKSQFMSTLAQALPDIKLDFPDAYQSWQSYLMNLDVQKTTPSLPEVTDDKLKLFLTGRNVYATYYSIKQAETRLAKHIIRAPFNGTLTEANINQGTLVRNGQQLGEFIKKGSFELEASVLFEELKYLKTEMEVPFSNVNSNTKYTGKLVRINNKVDPNSQLVKVFFKIEDNSIKSGLFLAGSIPATTYDKAVELPIQSLVEDKFVFTMESGKAIKKELTVLKQDANSFIAQGLSDGAVVVIDKKTSAFEGSEIISM